MKIQTKAMLVAHKLFSSGNITFSNALSQAWKMVKETNYHVVQRVELFIRSQLAKKEAIIAKAKLAKAMLNTKEIRIFGQTYDYKNSLKSLGFTWDSESKSWNGMDYLLASDSCDATQVKRAIESKKLSLSALSSKSNTSDNWESVWDLGSKSAMNRYLNSSLEA